MSILRATLFAVVLAALAVAHTVQSQESPFQLVEATIADVHRAIQQGQMTCRGLVEAYVSRARAYNGVSDRLVTRDGSPVKAVPGTVRARAPLEFPTETVASRRCCPTSISTPALQSSLDAWSPRRPIPTSTSSTA